MTNILFVDDEPRILSALRRVLRKHCRDWRLAFAESAQVALEHLEAEPFEVIVSDMRMPGMDGAELLTEVRRRSPGTVRIMLTGHSELEAAFRAVPVAHRFLTKPCEPQAIREVLEGALRLRALVPDQRVLRAAGGMDSLPARPSSCAGLTERLLAPQPQLEPVLELVRQDPAIAAKVLQIAGSAFFGATSPVTDLRRAVRTIGLDKLRDLAIDSKVLFGLDGWRTTGSMTSALDPGHALSVSALAGWLHGDAEADGVASSAGLLHDVGDLVLQTAGLAEPEADGAWTHADVGAYLLGIWGLAPSIVDAIRHHHRPSNVEDIGWGPAGAVHVADVLSHELGGTEPAQRPAPVLDEDYLRRTGAAERIPRWREQLAASVRTDPDADTNASHS